jgi:uncharacterized protein DUF3352
VRRLVVASTSLLVLLGVGVVASYLLLFGAATDRAARAAPADTAVYASAYLQPSAGQQTSLFGLIGKLQGFGDPAAMEQKIDEIAQRLLGGAGIDYLADVRPWLGAQIAIAASPGTDGEAPGMLLLAGVKDSTAASAAVPRLLAASGVRLSREVFRGRGLMTSQGTSYALLDDLLIVASTPARLRAALEAEANLAPSLADSAAFAAAMREVPTDRLASVYIDLPRVVGLGDEATLGGFGTAALAITADADGLHLDGFAPFATDGASEAARRAHALGDRTSTLADWIPQAAAAEAVVFGAADSFDDLESSLDGEDAFAPAVDALNQLRAVAAIGLGVNVDRDVLPLFDGEAAIALGRIEDDGPHGQLLLRPTDPSAAGAALDRMRTALADRGSRVTTRRVAGAVITTVAVPGVATVAYALVDGVVVVGLAGADVAAALEAHAAGDTLARDQRYRGAFELTGGHAGNEFWTDAPSLVDALAGIFDPGTEVRDILHQIGELAIRATAVDDRVEIHGVLTVN